MGITNQYADGIEGLAQLQRKLVRPPKRVDVPKLVDGLVKQAGLAGDPRERYFRLLATCALQNTEPRFRNWKKGETK